MRIALTAVALVTCLPLAAQQDHFTTSPAGWENVEGATSNDLIGKEPLLRFQQISSMEYRARGNRNRVAFRRDGLLPDNVAYGARSIELEMTMSESDFANVSTTFASNLTANTMTVVARKSVSFPDWTFKPSTAPAASADAIILFDSASIWNYPGKQASGTDKAFEIKVWSNTLGGQPYPMDADPYVETQVLGGSSTLGAGCVTPGQSRAMSGSFPIVNDGTNFVIDWGIGRGVANAPAVLVLDAVQQNISLGWCESVYAAGSFVPVTLDANGDFAGNFTVPYNAAYVGVPVYAQAACADASQPAGIALSAGSANFFPPAPTGNSGIVHLFALDPSASTATSGVVNGGVIYYSNHT